MNESGWKVAVLGFVWCWDMIGDASEATDSDYGARWRGESEDSPEGDRLMGT